MFSRTTKFDEALYFISQNKPLIKMYKKKPKFEEYTKLALDLSSLCPPMREKIGVFWIDDTTFALKTANFAKTIGLMPNTINCGLRQHHLVKIGNMPHEEVKDFEDKKNWKVMQDTRNRFTRTNASEYGNYHLLKWDKSKKQAESKEQTHPSIEDLSFEPDNNSEMLSVNNVESDFNIDDDDGDFNTYNVDNYFDTIGMFETTF